MIQVRKEAFEKAFKTLQRETGSADGIVDQRVVGAKTPRANQIYCGDCVSILSNAPAGWVDLVFADPPFNIGYLYHKYDDRKKTDEYLDFSERWMRAVHRALKPAGSFYLAIGDEYAAELKRFFET